MIYVCNIIVLLFLFPTVVLIYRSKIDVLKKRIENLEFFKLSKQASYKNRWFRSTRRPFFNPKNKPPIVTLGSAIEASTGRKYCLG